MTDLPLSPDDELASRYLDGDLDAVERARVEAEPNLLARVATFESLRRSLGDTALDPAHYPAAPGDPAGRSMLAAALAVFDELQAQEISDGAERGPAAAMVPVADMLALRRRQRRVLTWMGGAVAAAAVAVVAVGVGVGPRLGDPDRDDAAAPFTTVAPAAEERSADGDPETESAPAEGGADNANDAMAMSEAEPDAGSAFDEPAELAAPPETAAPTASPTTGDSTVLFDATDLRWFLDAHPLPQPGRCAAQPGVSSHGPATTGSRPVEVLFDVHLDVISAVDADSCAVVLQIERLP